MRPFPCGKTVMVLGAAGLVACVDSVAPKWDIDVLFPIEFPDIELGDIAAGATLPAADVPFTTPVATSDIDDTTAEILSEDVTAITVQYIVSTNVNVVGSLELTISPNRADLFSLDPSRAVTVVFPVRQTAGDTIAVAADVALFQNVPRIFLQSRGTVRSGTGSPLPIGPTDTVSLRVNLTATIEFVR